MGPIFVELTHNKYFAYRMDCMLTSISIGEGIAPWVLEDMWVASAGSR